MRNCAGCDVSLTNENTYAGVKKWCKACCCAKARDRRRTNPAVQEYDRMRSKTPERRAHNIRMARNWEARNPDGHKAHVAVRNAIQAGKLFRQPCEQCGASENIHAHHHDYSKPLDVEWLCAMCHHRLHARLESG